MPAWLLLIVQSVAQWLRDRKWSVAFALLAFFGGWKCHGVRVDVVGEPAPAVRSFGWLDDPDHVKATVATFARPFFGDAGKALVEGAEEKDAFLWRAYEKITGHP